MNNYYCKFVMNNLVSSGANVSHTLDKSVFLTKKIHSQFVGLQDFDILHAKICTNINCTLIDTHNLDFEM